MRRGHRPFQTRGGQVDDGCHSEIDVRGRDGKGGTLPITIIFTQTVLGTNGIGSMVRSLALKERKAELFLNEKRCIWRGISMSLDCRGRDSFFRAASGGDGGGTVRSALVFLAGVQI